MKTIRILASAVAILSLGCATAMAQGAPNVKKACAADIQKYCPGIADRHAERQCMKSHMTEVSPDCHTAVVAAKAARAERKAAAASAAAPPSVEPAPTATPH